MADPIDPAPVDIGRDNSVDGLSTTNTYLSEIVVENYTPYQRSEILTRTITLEQDAFPVPLFANDPDTTPISVSSSDDDDAYVQWEPMGDLYPATEASPYGSYKYLRVHFDVNVPAGSSTGELSLGHATRPGPYQYYSAKTYIFQKNEPLVVPSFTLTPGVLSALGAFGNTPVTLQLSGHGYVNNFSMSAGLYGQDIQTDFPSGSALTVPFREVIYNRHFGEIGSITESPVTQGQACLKKEYMVHGRIVPDLDVSTAAFNPATGDTSGADAPTFWYNFHYELQHEKNVIPFVLQWGVGLATYDDGTWNPSGIDIDYKDRRTGKLSSNHGNRAKSREFIDHIKNNTASNYRVPLIFSSTEDVTFSIIGPDVASPASSVDVCSTYVDTYSGSQRTVFNWFDKANRSDFEIANLGINCLPYTSIWTLRGKILINDNYESSIVLTTLEEDTQNAEKLEELQGLDQNFHSRGLFTPFKWGYPESPSALYTSEGYTDMIQLATYILNSYWDGDGYSVSAYRMPLSLVKESISPFFGEAPYYIGTVNLLKNLHDPWAQSPIGLAARPGIQGGQPGFNIIGFGGLNAKTGCADLRFLQKCTDLEWNRAFVETERDGQLLNFDGEQWKARRFTTNPGNISNTHLNAYIRNNVSANSTEWVSKSINSPEFSSAKTYIEESNVVAYEGLNPTFIGTSNLGWYRGQRNIYYNTANTDSFGIAMVQPFGRLAGSGRTRRYEANPRVLGYPISKTQSALGYPGYNYFWNNDKQSYVPSHTACSHQIGYALLTGDKIALKLIDYYINAFSNNLGDMEPARSLFYSQLANAGNGFQNVGRQEGRPYNALVMALGASKNSTLREKTIYRLSRRFWNAYIATQFEDYPFGVPNAPWKTIRYPAWCDGVSAVINNQGLPEISNIGPTIGLFSDYWNYYSLAGDPYTWNYVPSKLKIEDINQDFDRDRAISWDAFSVQQLVSDIFVDSKFALEKSTSSTFKISCNESPGASSIDPTTNSLTRRKARLYITEAFQNALRYPYFSPIMNMFNAYSTIYANKNGSIPFYTKHTSYSTLSSELADSYTEFKNLLVRFSRSAIRNLLLKVSSSSSFAANKYAMSYLHMPYSASRFMEDYTDTDRFISFGPNEEIEIPVICSVSALNDKDRLTEFPLHVCDSVSLGAMYKALIRNTNLGDGSFSTNSWTFTLLPWAWDILNTYGNGLYDQELEIAKSYIIDMVGTSPYDASLAASNTDIRNSIYPRYWGTVGVPSPGNNSVEFDGSLGSHEALTWWTAVTDDLWKDRTLGFTYLSVDVRNESEFDSEFEVSSATTAFEGNWNCEGLEVSAEINVITQLTGYLRDEGGDGMSLTVEASSSSDPTVIVYLLPGYYGEFVAQSQSLVVSANVPAGFLGEFDATVTPIIPLAINGTFEGGTEFEIGKPALGTNISIFSGMGESEFIVSSYDVFVNLNLADYVGETLPELSGHTIQFNLGTAYVGEFGGSAIANAGPNISLDWVGETITLAEFIDLNPDYAYLGELYPSISFTIYPGTPSNRDDNPRLQMSFSAASAETISNNINELYEASRTGMSQRVRFEREIFKEISSRSRGDENVSQIYKLILEYLINSFGSLVVIDNENEIKQVPCWHANAERAVAKLKKGANVVLPVISVSKERTEVDLERRRSASLLVHDKMFDIEKQRAIRVVSLAPVAVKIMYKVHVWAKYQEDLDQLTEQINRMFNPDMEVYTKYNSTTKAYLSEEDDASELNIGDGADRVLRKVFTISVEGYIPNPKFMITNTGRIEEINTEVCIPI